MYLVRFSADLNRVAVGRRSAQLHKKWGRISAIQGVGLKSIVCIYRADGRSERFARGQSSKREPTGDERFLSAVAGAF